MHDFLSIFNSALQRQPWWMRAVWLFCLYMTFIYMPWDFFFKSRDAWEQVWLGFTIRGWPAKLSEPVHWAIYAAGSWGFLHMRRWMWPWTAIYCAQVMISMIIFNVIAGPAMGDGRGGGPLASVLIGAFLAWLTWKLWRSKPLFEETSPAHAQPVSDTDNSAACRDSVA